MKKKRTSVSYFNIIPLIDYSKYENTLYVSLVTEDVKYTRVITL